MKTSGYYRHFVGMSRRLMRPILGLGLSGCALCAWAEWYSAEATAMTTRIGVEFWTEKPETAPALAEAVFAEMRRIEDLMSSYRPKSVLSKLNSEAAKAAFSPGSELFGLIQQAQAISKLSDGAFDITFPPQACSMITVSISGLTQPHLRPPFA